MLSLKKYAIPYTVLYGEPSDENGLSDGKVSMLIGFVGFWVSHLKVFHYVHCFMHFFQFLGCWEIEILILTWKAGIVLRIRARVDTMTKPMEMTAITCDRVWNRILSERFFVGNVNLFFLKQRALGDQKVLLFFILLMVLQEMCQFQFICEVFKVIIGINIYKSELTNASGFYKRRKSAEKFKMVTADGS